VAAVAVVAGHFVVATSAPLASQFFGHPQRLTGLDYAFAETPLAVVWAGQEWVIVFFVLSGVVLSLAAAGGGRFDAVSYYPVRIVRLYLPVWACLVFAGIVHEAIAHHAVAGATAWLNLHAAGWSASETAHDMGLLVHPGDYFYTTVLWTLQWEVAFSIALPLFLICAARMPRRVVVAAALLVVVVGGPGSGVLRYMPVFMLGTVIAFSREQVRAALAGRLAYAATLAASPVLLVANHWMPGGRWQGPALGLVVVGASGLICAAMVPGRFSEILESRPLQAVGRRSFSLYLVHEPLIVATAFALGGRPSTVILAACALPPIALATVVFYRWIERPSHGLARNLGQATSRLVNGRRNVVPAEAEI
jgi:peptidoglycan/LPS O-acetylase OafA/YrhL